MWSTLRQWKNLKEIGDLSLVDFHVILLSKSESTEALLDCLDISYSIPKNAIKILDVMWASKFFNIGGYMGGKSV